ncbi:hypothetical protein ACFWF3_07720, partial [Nocardia sp. NPDC060220]|uniref:hypothetical protein n=1 Tax=Nocardia sp. NPDC060220 TaxID=3347076 RepID=UPI0036508ABB
QMETFLTVLAEFGAYPAVGGGGGDPERPGRAAPPPPTTVSGLDKGADGIGIADTFGVSEVLTQQCAHFNTGA